MNHQCSFCGFITKYKISAKRHLKTCKAAKQQREQQLNNTRTIAQAIDVDLVSRLLRSLLEGLTQHSTVSAQQQKIITQRSPSPQPSTSTAIITPKQRQSPIIEPTMPTISANSQRIALKRPAPTPINTSSKLTCFHCEVCNISCTSKLLLSAHKRTQIHMRKLSTQYMGDHVTAIENTAFENRIITLNINHLGKNNVDIRTFLNYI